MSARDRNFGVAMRERERRIAGLLDDPYDTTAGAAISDPAGNAFWGSLRELGQRAADAGMGFRADVGSLGRPQGMSDDGSGLNYFDKQSLKNQALQQFGNASALQAKAEQEQQRAVNDQRERALIGDLQRSYDEQKQASAGLVDTSTPEGRQAFLALLPAASPARAAYERQFEAQDQARADTQLKADEARARIQSLTKPIVVNAGDTVIDPKTGQPIYSAPPKKATGRGVIAGDASDLADFDTSKDELAAVRAAISPEDSTGIVAQIGAKIPFVTQITGWGSDAKKRQAVIDRVKQVIGKTLEGGVLRKEDETKYEKILPTIGDPESVAKAKLDGLDAAITKRKERRLSSLEDAGYDVSAYRQRAGSGADADVIYARDPQGNIHQGKRGTPLPPGWQETAKPGGGQ